MTQKTTPFNPEAEAAVLGCILIDPDALPPVHAILDAKHFYELKHQWIFEACLDLHQHGDPIDLLTLTTELDKRGRLTRAGGAVYISQLINAVPSAVQAKHYAKIVHETWQRRQVLDLASDVAKIAHDEGNDLDGAIEYLRTRLEDLRYVTPDRTYQSFAELSKTLQPIQWLWPDWIPQGMITLLGAVPGAGKSLVALDLAKRVIHGEAFPDGTANPHEGRNVIYVDAELVPQLINERVKMWQIDINKLFLMLPNPNGMIDFVQDEYRVRLWNMVETLRPGLVVIDSLSSVTSKGENTIEDMREVLGYLNELATTHQVGLLLIHHLRKRGNNQYQSSDDIGIDDFRGSSHIIAMSRSVIGLSVVQTAPEPDRNGPRKMEIVKTNLAAYPEPVGCELLPLHPKGIYLKWDTEAPKPYREPTQTEMCAEWLANALRDLGEPIRPKEVIEMAEEVGFSRATIYRAKEQLGDKVHSIGHRPNTEWEYNTDS
jgi:hypothetical protein